MATSPDVTPVTPTMGGLSQLTKNESSLWTGGKPKPDWSGLEGNPQSYTSPNQLRPVSVTASQKGYNHRKAGMATKFKRGDDVYDFQKKVWEHFTDNGLDTVAHLQDPGNPSRMMNVVKEHPRFTLATAKELSNEQVKLYDTYDIANDACARMFLLDSISTDLSKHIDERLDENPTFAAVWLQFIKTIQSTSMARFEDIVRKIEARKASQYSGENLETMASDYRRDALELSTAGHYDHKLTLKMTKSFLHAGGPGNEDFRSPLRNKWHALETALLAIAHKDKAAQDQYMISNEFTYMDICRAAEDGYRRQYDASEWPPAQHARDSKAVPSNFGANTLYPSAASGGSGSDGTFTGICYNCNKPGHMSRKCPLPKREKRSPNGHRTPAAAAPAAAGNRPPRTNDNRPPSVWKNTPPAAGDPTTKEMHGKPFHWCAKCKRWTTTHSTASHTGQPRNTAAANHALIPDASAWYVNIGMDTVLDDIWDLFIPSWVAVLIGFLMAHFPVFAALRAARSAAAFIWEHNYSLLAPLLWFCMVFLILLGPYLLIDYDEIERRTRSQRRLNDQYFHRERSRMRRFCNCGSIRHHGLHRQYPMSLRSLGHFIRCAPTVQDRELNRTVSLLRDQVQTLIRTVDSLRTPHVHSRIFGRKGVNRNRPNDSDVPRPGPPHRSQHHNAEYQPIPAHGHHRCGNNRLTHRQVQAAQKISSHFNMARINLGLSPVDNAATLRMALQAPHCFRQAFPKEAMMSIIWDSGASLSISFDKSDFVGELHPAGAITRLQGIAKGLRIEGKGHVLWPMLDVRGQLRLIKLPAFYAPSCKVRLLSTTSLLQTYPDETIKVDATQMRLSGLASDPTRGAVIAAVNPRNNLPMATSYRYDAVEAGPLALSAAISLTNDANTNLSEPEKELLRWHARLGHLSFRKIQFLMRTGILSRSESTRRLQVSASKLSHPPKCAACQFGKQSQRPSPGQKTTAVKDRAGVLKTDHLFPGQCVSVDHFVCSTKGRLFTSAGKTNEDEMYTGGCLFVDHATNHVHIEFQARLNTHQTLRAKGAYELMCRDYGVVPQTFVSDNGKPFVSAEFSQQLAKFEQVIRFAGAGAHHQNGNAERAIQTIMSISRTMMLHQAIHWPDVADASLWPMAVAHAVYLYNHVPDPATGLSAHYMFTRTRWEQSKFHDLHVWGCPVYVLEKTMSDGKKLPRWKPRSHRTINMGLSPNHASTVPLVLNPDTGYITAQFHVVFDDWFATVSSDSDKLPDFQSPEWSQLFGDSVYQYPFDDDDLADAIELTAPPTPTNADRVARAMDQLQPPMPFRSAPPAVTPLPQLIVGAGPAPATSPATTSSPREPVISVPREPAMSAQGSQ
jgi:hypothetical protein